MQIAWQKHGYYSKTPLLLHYKSNGVYTKFCIDCGAGGFRTHVQTGKYCAFYTFISAFICQIITRPEPPIITLVFKISSKNQDLFRLFPIFLHHWIHWFGTTSLEWCLVPLPCNGIKLVIYYTSIKQRERSYFRQLIFW